MQTTRHSDLPLNIALEVQAEPQVAKSMPIELSLSDLKHVSGGQSPNGTWSSGLTTQSPNGTW